MLSYRHAFHAGNHADVLKHSIIVHILRHLAQKEKAFWYLDTHAGAGVYELLGAYASQTAEYETGIARLWTQSALPPLLADYIAQVRALNDTEALRFYPGSPWLAWHLTRNQDRLRLFELHPTEIKILRDNFAQLEPDGKARTLLHAGDGFSGLKGLLPPPPRRAVVLLDPSYEDKQDYQRVLDTLQQSLQRFATGTYAVWYPQVQRLEAQRFAKQLKHISEKNWLHAALQTCAPPRDGYGLYGSGMFILNPPYSLADNLRTALPYLVQTLGQDSAATFTLEQHTL
ncbi:MAG: 23S rRNA (adenine2030-N6)-methyltransferase [Glomeribacter sp. 1016415]|nr:23S rRNA (adenine2030-N6)-methyltransferase [Glomeribacter sp. 1016415]